MSFHVTFIVAVPSFFAVIFPSCDTSKISLLSLFHTSFLFSIQLGVTFTFNILELPTNIFSVSFSNFTSSFSTFIVTVLLILGLSTDVAVIFAIPVPTASIFPFWSTFAIFSLFVVHFTSLFFAVFGPKVTVTFAFSPANKFMFSLTNLALSLL